MNLVEHAGSAACVIKKCIVRGVELFSSGIGALHGKCDPVAEAQSLSENSSILDGEFGRCIQEESAAGFQYAAALQDPLATPAQIVGLGAFVVVAVSVVLADVEWGIGEDGVDDARPHAAEKLETIHVEEDAVRCREEGVDHASVRGLGGDPAQSKGG